uniref:Pentraxin family member n=1 Tax=Neogobius melanostomus TaxID=47308 RepID=A0A8C6TED5_9GOBI
MRLLFKAKFQTVNTIKYTSNTKYINISCFLDMTGKVFTFPRESNTDHVRLNTGYDKSLSVLTICHRSFTDLTRNHALFSLATPSRSNDIMIYYNSAPKLVEPHFCDAKAGYGGLDYAPNKWHSMCSTWDSNVGLIQLWFNGQPLTRKLGPGSTITGQPIIILGQDQDSYGGGFDPSQSFVGMMTDVHMWDHEISPCEIQKYMEELIFTPGNVLNWAALDFQTNGKSLYRKQCFYRQAAD